MSAETEINLAAGVLDHQLVDSEGRRCGRVDDLELSERDPPSVMTILWGPPVRKRRVHGTFTRLIAGLGPVHTIQIPWEEVEKVGPVLELGKPAQELGLRTLDDRVREWLDRLRRRR
jgi:sporulation protein YlmC with PRC-barrel domain